MPILLSPWRRTRQPQGPVQVDPKYSYGLNELAFQGNSLLNGSAWTNASATYDVGSQGRRVNQSSTGGGLSIVTATNGATSDQTLLFYGTVTGYSGQYAGLIGTSNASGSSASLQFLRNASNNGWLIGNATVDSSLGASDPLTNAGVVCLVVSSIGGSTYSYVNGSFWASVASGASSCSDCMHLLFRERTGSASYTTSGTCYLRGFWGVGFNAETAKQVSANPWQIFSPEPRRLWWYGTSAGGSTVDATATGATVVASSTAIAGALTAASAATAATVAASASAIAGAATSSSQAAAATVTVTASATNGAATGAGQSAAATVAATASATGAAATAASATTAATITASSAAIAGAASGTAAATATGATVVADVSIIAGSATGNAAGTATGATVAADASAIAGALSASAAATGQTAAVTASATAGSAQSDHAATGAVVSASTTAIPGAIAVGAGATTLGATVAATVTYQSGAVAAASSAAGWTQVVTAIAARGVAYGALPDIDPRYLVPSRKRRFTVQARGRRFNART